jgi:hypothetical protein
MADQKNILQHFYEVFVGWNPIEWHGGSSTSIPGQILRSFEKVHPDKNMKTGDTPCSKLISPYTIWLPISLHPC